MDQGILYIATGEQVFNEAKQSVESLRAYMPDIQVAVVTDVDEPDHGNFTKILIDDPDYSFRDKVQYMTESPFNRTLFLDSDTYITGDLSEVFDLLDRFDIAASQAGYRRIQFHPHAEDDVATDEIPISYPEFNTGVIAFRNTTPVHNVLSNWKVRYDKHLDIQPDVGTQPSFLEVVYESNIDIATLPEAYNCHAHFLGTISQPARIIHTHSDNIDEVANQLNMYPTTSRSYLPYKYGDLLGEIMVYEGAYARQNLPSTLSFYLKFHIFLLLIKKKGITYSINTFYEHIK